MGRDWLTWVGGGDGGSGRFSGRRGKTARKTKEAVGCMSVVFQLLHFQPPSNLDPHIITTTPEGAEAPRNGPKFNQQPITAANDKEEEELEQTNFLRIQVKSRRGDELSIDSPSLTKTPSLVAHLMGLDLLPECAFPSTLSGLQSNLLRSINGVQSLPETPRMSLARRSSECHSPRLSLRGHEIARPPSNFTGESTSTSSSSGELHRELCALQILTKSPRATNLGLGIAKFGGGMKRWVLLLSFFNIELSSCDGGGGGGGGGGAVEEDGCKRL